MGVYRLEKADRFYSETQRQAAAVLAGRPATKLAQLGAGAMDMEEILGMSDGDFEGVEFAESGGSDGEEEEHAGGAAEVVPRSDTTTTGNSTSAEISNVENTPVAAAAAGPSPAAMEVTTIVQVGGCLGCCVEGPRGRAPCDSNLATVVVVATRTHTPQSPCVLR